MEQITYTKGIEIAKKELSRLIANPKNNKRVLNKINNKLDGKPYYIENKILWTLHFNPIRMRFEFIPFRGV